MSITLNPKIKINSKVSWTRKNGEPAQGKVVAIDDVPGNGTWIQVNTAAPKQPAEIWKLRPAQLSPA